MTWRERRNPWNIKSPTTGQLWRGQDGADERGHAVFADECLACRAAIRTFANYQVKDGLKTIEAMIATWAPLDDGNKPDEYAAFVADKCNHPADQAYPLFVVPGGGIMIGDELKRFLSAVAHYETGDPTAAHPLTLEAGIALYRRDFT